MDTPFDITLSNGDEASAETVEAALFAAYHLQLEARTPRKLGGWIYPAVEIFFEGESVLKVEGPIDVRQVYTYEPRVAHLLREQGGIKA